MPDLERAWPDRPERSHNSVSLPYQKAFATPMGPVLLSADCSSSFVEQLSIDDGLHAFAHRPDREYALLLDLAGREDCSLALAYTPAGAIVGQLTLAPADDWWQETPDIHEVAFEVSSDWRNQGIAHQLIELVAGEKQLEDTILLGVGLSWHWDIKGSGLLSYQYRAMLAHLARPYGFAEYQTSEPNIREDPANILLVRIGSAVGQQTLSGFYASLFRSDTLPGL